LHAGAVLELMDSAGTSQNPNSISLEKLCEIIIRPTIQPL